MAFHKHFKLPPYKLTQRWGAATKVRSIHRGDSAQYDRPVQSTTVTEERETCSEPSQCIPSFPCRDGHEVSLCNEQEPLASPEEPTLHELQSKASVKGWSKPAEDGNVVECCKCQCNAKQSVVSCLL